MSHKILLQACAEGLESGFQPRLVSERLTADLSRFDKPGKNPVIVSNFMVEMLLRDRKLTRRDTKIELAFTFGLTFHDMSYISTSKVLHFHQ